MSAMLQREVEIPEDPELAKFRAGMRKRFHVHYEEQARIQRNGLVIAIVCGLGACGYLAFMIWGPM